MNVLLVMPKTGYLGDEWATPPIGIAYVSAYLKVNGVNVYTVNLNLEDRDVYEVLEEKINKYDIGIVGTGELVVNLRKIQEIAEAVKKIKPQIKVWIGGSLVTNSPYEAMELVPEADFGMIGEGELTSLELVRMLESMENPDAEDIKKIDGLIVRRKDGTFYCTDKRADIENLDSIPFPDWEGFRLVETCRKYAKEDNSITASIVSSRSCPNSCTFCSKTGGKKYRKRSLDNIFKEIDELVNKYHVNRLNFNDELFADNSDRLYQFCDRIETYHLSYRISMHIGKNLNLELLSRMYKSGCKVIFYGLESADNNVLMSMRKHITIDEIERCLQITKQAGIIVEGNFIFGDPAETKETVKTTLNWIEDHYTMGLIEVAPIKLYPGSQLYEDAVNNGSIKDTVKFIEEGCPLVNVSGLSDVDYRNMINNDLTVIQKMRLKRQEGLELFGVGEGRIGVKAFCPGCGEKIEFIVEDTSHILRMYTEHCPICGTLEYLNLFPVYYDKIRKKLELIFREHKVGIFGCGNIWKMFYSVGDIFKEAKYDIIDETPFLQNEGWNGRKVYSPDMIAENRIDTLIVMIRTSRKEIQEKLMREYHIEKLDIIMCYDMM